VLDSNFTPQSHRQTTQGRIDQPRDGLAGAGKKRCIREGPASNPSMACRGGTVALAESQHCVSAAPRRRMPKRARRQILGRVKHQPKHRKRPQRPPALKRQTRRARRPTPVRINVCAKARPGLLRACPHGMMSFAQQTHFFEPCSGGILTCM